MFVTKYFYLSILIKVTQITEITAEMPIIAVKQSRRGMRSCGSGGDALTPTPTRLLVLSKQMIIIIYRISNIAIIHLLESYQGHDIIASLK